MQVLVNQNGTTVEQEVRIVTHKCEGARAKEALLVALDWGFAVKLLTNPIEQAHPWDITLHDFNEPVTSDPLARRSPRAIRAASYLVPKSKWGGSPNRIGIYSNSQSLELAIPEAIFNIERWRCNNRDGLPWVGHTPETSDHWDQYQTWLEETQEEAFKSLYWTATPNLGERLSLYNSRYETARRNRKRAKQDRPVVMYGID